MIGKPTFQRKTLDFFRFLLFYFREISVMIEVSKEKEGKNNYEKNMKNSVETRNLYIIGDSYAHFTKWSN